MHAAACSHCRDRLAENAGHEIAGHHFYVLQFYAGLTIRHVHVRYFQHPGRGVLSQVFTWSSLGDGA